MLDKDGRVKTIQQLELAYYGQMAKSAMLNKADTNMTTSTTGYFNNVYGALAWSQLNLEANAWAVLPKVPYKQSGFRLITSKMTMAESNGVSALGGTPESGNIADAVLPDVKYLKMKPYIAQIVFGSSTVHNWIAKSTNDDAIGMDFIRTFAAVNHKENMHKMLLTDIEDLAGDASGNYAGTTNWESLDRLISSDAEEDALGGAHNDWYDPYDDLDRDATDIYDSVVRSASGTIGTNGVLTQSVIMDFYKDMMEEANKYGNVILTGHDVHTEIQEIFSGQTRYKVGEMMIELGVNGAQTFRGHNVGLQVASLFGVPLIPTKDAPRDVDDASEVGRLLMLDTTDLDGFGQPRLGLGIAIPTSYSEIGLGTPMFPLVQNKFVEKGIYWTFGQTLCTKFNSQGKLRDIKL